MPLRVASRQPLLTSAFVALTAVATWTFTSIGHADVQITVKHPQQAPVGADADSRAATPSKPSRG